MSTSARASSSSHGREYLQGPTSDSESESNIATSTSSSKVSSASESDSAAGGGTGSDSCEDLDWKDDVKEVLASATTVEGLDRRVMRQTARLILDAMRYKEAKHKQWFLSQALAGLYGSDGCHKIIKKLSQKGWTFAKGKSPYYY